MHIRYTWKPEEWREVRQLVAGEPRRGAKPMLTYAVIGIMALGGAGDLVNVLRSSSFVSTRGSLSPVLVLAALVCVGAGIYSRQQRRRAAKDEVPMPKGEQALLLREDGWHCAEAGAAEHALGPLAMRPWEELEEQRTGKWTITLVGPESRWAAVPLRVLTPAQGGHLHRLLSRKLRRDRWAIEG